MDKTAICNLALALVGEKSITSIDDESRVAELCSVNWDAARDAVLEARPWSFAIVRRSIAAAGAAPDWGPTKRFPLPATVLRALQASDGAEDLDDWRVEDRHVLTDYEGPVKVRSIEQVEDPAKFSPGFVQALAAYLAYVLAVPITESRTLKADLWQEYQLRVKEAGALDGMQGRSKQSMTASWVRRARE
jgi:hypothetical protein